MLSGKHGADGMVEKANIRILEGMAAVFVRETSDGRIVVSAGQKERVLLKDNWLALPPYGEKAKKHY
jgi:hypothetical protein